MNVVRSIALSKDEELREIRIPKDARILSVCVIQEKMLIFIEEDVNTKTKDRQQKVEIAVFKNGRHFYVDDYKFLGTVVLDFGNTIYHVYYRNV